MTIKIDESVNQKKNLGYVHSKTSMYARALHANEDSKIHASPSWTSASRDKFGNRKKYVTNVSDKELYIVQR